MHNQEVIDLILKAEQLAKYYYKGFGQSLTGSKDTIEAFMFFANKENANIKSLKEKYHTRFNNIISPLLIFYEELPIEKLSKIEEFSPLIQINKILLNYYVEADSCFYNVLPFDSFNNTILLSLNKKVNKINNELGWKYRNQLTNTVNLIRTNKNYENFDIKLFDDKADTFYVTEL